MRWRSKLGTICAVLYVILFAAVYVDYLHHKGTWLDDLGLNVVTLPYVLVGRLFTGDPEFALHGPALWSLAGGLLFCAMFMYLAGLAVERLWRQLVVWSKRE